MRSAPVYAAERERGKKPKTGFWSFAGMGRDSTGFSFDLSPFFPGKKFCPLAGRLELFAEIAKKDGISIDFFGNYPYNGEYQKPCF